MFALGVDVASVLNNITFSEEGWGTCDGTMLTLYWNFCAGDQFREPSDNVCYLEDPGASELCLGMGDWCGWTVCFVDLVKETRAPRWEKTRRTHRVTCCWGVWACDLDWYRNAMVEGETAKLYLREWWKETEQLSACDIESLSRLPSVAALANLWLDAYSRRCLVHEATPRPWHLLSQSSQMMF